MSRFRKGKKAARRFDGLEWAAGTSGKQRKIASRYLRWQSLLEEQMMIAAEEVYDDWDINDGWCCSCGHYQEDDMHCDMCGGEPPWGCDCTFCNDRAREVDDDFIPGDFYGMADGL